MKGRDRRCAVHHGRGSPVVFQGVPGRAYRDTFRAPARPRGRRSTIRTIRSCARTAMPSSVRRTPRSRCTTRWRGFLRARRLPSDGHTPAGRALAGVGRPSGCRSEGPAASETKRARCAWPTRRKRHRRRCSSRGISDRSRANGADETAFVRGHHFRPWLVRPASRPSDIVTLCPASGQR